MTLSFWDTCFCRFMQSCVHYLQSMCNTPLHLAHIIRDASLKTKYKTTAVRGATEYMALAESFILRAIVAHRSKKRLYFPNIALVACRNLSQKSVLFQRQDT